MRGGGGGGGIQGNQQRGRAGRQGIGRIKESSKSKGTACKGARWLFIMKGRGEGEGNQSNGRPAGRS